MDGVVGRIKALEARRVIPCVCVCYFTQGYFDTLRMEVIDKGIAILMICPGPTNVLTFREVLGKHIGTEKDKVVYTWYTDLCLDSSHSLCSLFSLSQKYTVEKKLRKK